MQTVHWKGHRDLCNARDRRVGKNESSYDVSAVSVAVLLNVGWPTSQDFDGLTEEEDWEVRSFPPLPAPAAAAYAAFFLHQIMFLVFPGAWHCQ